MTTVIGFLNSDGTIEKTSLDQYMRRERQMFMGMDPASPQPDESVQIVVASSDTITLRLEYPAPKKNRQPFYLSLPKYRKRR